MTQSDGAGPVDWRGTRITPGALVIYGAPVGRSIAMVEATVADPMVTKSGRIWLDVQRRAYGGGYSPGGRGVHVGADRLTVVTALPHSTRLTEQEIPDGRAAHRARRITHLARVHVEAEHPDPGTWTDDDGTIRPHMCQPCWHAGCLFDEAWEAGEHRAAQGGPDPVP